MNRTLLIALLLLTFSTTFAQVPTITSISPEKGLIGSFVTINGSNFGLTPPENIVYFGALRGEVVPINSNQIVVHSPAATYQPVTITVNGRTVYSQRPFMSIVPGPPFTAASLRRTDIPSSGNHAISVKDFDGDNKADIAVVGGTQLLILKNKSTVGNPDFFIDVNKPVSYAMGLGIGDLNCDGKPDIVTTNYFDDKISIFMNNSSAGALNFADVESYSTDRNPYRVSIADFNGDGIPDIAVTIESAAHSSVFVFENTTPLNGRLTLRPPKKFATAISPRGIETGDIDLDGKIDIVVPCQYGGLTVLRNISTLNNIAFEPYQSFALPSGSAPESVVLADFDGDLKLDVAVANNQSNNISVFKGGAGGALLGGRQDYATGVNNFGISVGDLDSDGYPDIAVTNQSDNSVSVLINKSSPDNILFSNKMDYAVGAGPRSSALADVDGDFKHDVIVANNNTNFISILLSNTDKQQAVINFPTLSAKLVCDADFSANASSNTTQPLFYSSSNTAVATISPTGVIHIVSPGTTTIMVTQPGNAIYIDAAPKSQVLTITAPVAPTVTITADNNSVCNGSAAIFTANALNSGLNPTYQWTVNGSAQGLNSNKLTVNNIQATDVVQCSVTQGGGCSASGVSNSLSVTVQPMLTPGLSIQMAAGTFCEGSAISFTATPVNEGSQPRYEWLVNNLLIGTTPNPQFSYSGFRNGDKISCTLTNTTSSCLAVSSATSSSIIVNIADPPHPQLSIATPSTKVYGSTDVTFTATSSLPVSVYQWQINNVNYGSNQPYFITSSLKSGDRVKCIVTVNAPCAVPQVTDEIVMDVILPTDIKIPNTFTPNSDGINDVWAIPELSFFPNCVVNIFDRNGSLIFFSRGYANAWDGTTNGKKLPKGVYYYVIRTDTGKGLQRKGYITILR